MTEKKVPTTDEKVDYLLKLMGKIADLLEESVTQQAEILDQMKNRDLIGEDYRVLSSPFEDQD